MRTSQKLDFSSREIAKNNFSGIDISQGLDLEPPSLSPYFLLVGKIEEHQRSNNKSKRNKNG